MSSTISLSHSIELAQETYLELDVMITYVRMCVWRWWCQWRSTTIQYLFLCTEQALKSRHGRFCRWHQCYVNWVLTDQFPWGEIQGSVTLSWSPYMMWSYVYQEGWAATTSRYSTSQHEIKLPTEDISLRVCSPNPPTQPVTCSPLELLWADTGIGLQMSCIIDQHSGLVFRPIFRNGFL